MSCFNARTVHVIFTIKFPIFSMMPPLGSVDALTTSAITTCEITALRYTERCKQVYGGFLKWWYPKIIHFNRVFHYFHHPFWGTPIFGITHICPRDPITMSEDDWGVQSSPKRTVFRFHYHYHSQKVSQDL